MNRDSHTLDTEIRDKLDVNRSEAAEQRVVRHKSLV